jgi:hypothetical protein
MTLPIWPANFMSFGLQLSSIGYGSVFCFYRRASGVLDETGLFVLHKKTGNHICCPSRKSLDYLYPKRAGKLPLRMSSGRTCLVIPKFR